MRTRREGFRNIDTGSNEPGRGLRRNHGPRKVTMSDASFRGELPDHVQVKLMSERVGVNVGSEVVRMTRYWKYRPCKGWPALSTSCPLFTTTAQLDQVPSGVAVLPTRTWTVSFVLAGTLAVQLAVFHVTDCPASNTTEVNVPPLVVVL